ncbi:YaiI/YqxD family protein [Thalassotalea agarivorans]|uniref:UPF0178 protein SAMN05660429_01811 n=1 Tax=Thalassotalea agarivorans TaxID=349064 RepID=A0A1I0EDN0_THASX|nr:YaiI/YqxD family protein [Thalassotalea agarivorans]SET42647.1 hypothetical protein SAMN05660429_01811 [Thalassotalea agarivorans]
MAIWVDADACPVPIKDIIFRAADRAKEETTLVANHAMRIPPSQHIKFVRVESGFDVADNLIVVRANKGDLVITSDIPLASEVIDKGCLALNPRGELYTKENIKQRLNMRDFFDTLRSSGIETKGAAPLNQQDKQRFANELDKWLARR